MSRHLITLWNTSDRKRAHQYIEQAPDMTRVEFSEKKTGIRHMRVKHTQNDPAAKSRSKVARSIP